MQANETQQPADDGRVLSEGLGPNVQAVARWYCVSREGLATLCKDGDDALATAAHCDQAWPGVGPHRASLLVDAADLAQLQHALAQSRALADARLTQMKADRVQALGWRDEAARLRIGHDRYETARRMSPRQWADAWKLNVSTGKGFDEIVDELRPFMGPNAVCSGVPAGAPMNNSAGGTSAGTQG